MPPEQPAEQPGPEPSISSKAKCQVVRPHVLPAAAQRGVFFVTTPLTVTFVALMFTTIHCKIKRILIVGICYSLGMGGG